MEGSPFFDVFFILAFIFALAYALWNGANDAANNVAAPIGTGALTHNTAVILAGVAGFLGLVFAWLVGSAVAKTIGKGLLAHEFITQSVILGGIIGAVLWAAIITRFGIPVSITHSLVGGVLGAGFAKGGTAALSDETGTLPFVGEIPLLYVIFSGIILAPMLGFFGAYLLRIICALITFPFHLLRSTMNRFWRRVQVPSCVWLAFTHGMNDGQNTVGILALAAFAAGVTGSAETITWWMIVFPGVVMALGTIFLSKRVIETGSEKIETDLEPADGAAAHLAEAAVLTAKSLAGIPVSTTHVAMAGIAGAGAAKELRTVDPRYNHDVRNILTAWVATIPAAALAGAGSYFLFSLFFS